MRLVRLALLGLPVWLSACGHSDPTATLSVSCNNETSLAGATSIEVAPAPGGEAAMLSFPDPANPGRTATLPVAGGHPCTITPVLSKS